MAEKADENKQTPPEAKGMSPMVFMGAAGASMLLMLGGGFAVAYFVLPGKIAGALEERIKVASATSAHGEGESSEHSGSEEKHGEEGKKEEGKEEASAKGHGEAKEGEKKEEGGHGETKEGEKKEEGGHGEGGGKEKKEAENFILSEILVNVNGTGGGRFLKASLYFDAPPKTLKDLETIRPKIIDLVSQILRSKTLDQLTREDSMANLRAELISRVNAILPQGKVDNIYFLDLVIQ